MKRATIIATPPVPELRPRKRPNTLAAAEAAAKDAQVLAQAAQDAADALAEEEATESLSAGDGPSFTGSIFELSSDASAGCHTDEPRISPSQSTR